MILINKDSGLIQYPYYVINDEFYEKLKTHLIIGVLKIIDNKIISIEQTPTLNLNSGYTSPKTFKPSDKIWRYMEVFKFEDLIKSSSLYMCRLDGFEDNLEGISPESCKNSILIDDRLDNEKKKEQLKLFNERTWINRKNGFVCCWHINDNLNSAMWEEYGKNSQEAVAIETNTGLLKKSFINKTLPIVFEYIRYFDEPFFNQETYWFPSLFKQKKFEFEKEFRCAIFAENLYDSKFTRLKVNLQSLIRKIHLHPNASNEQIIRIEKLLADKSLKIPIEIRQK